jgi:serine protease Do
VVLAASRGRRGLRVTFGLVSGVEAAFRGPRGRRITGSVEHTAPLARGASGGPLLDRAGRLLGVNTNRLGEGFYLAIPADEELGRRLDALGRGEAPARPRLGIGIAPADVAKGLRGAVGLPEIDGLLVRFVEDGGPAARAGVAVGDLIVGVAGRALASPDDLHERLEEAGSEGAVELQLVRGTSERVVTVPLAQGDPE